MEQGLVSVIVPVYNREKYVGGAILSILAQTYQSIEIILVNDGSSDRSLEIIREFKVKHPNKIIVIDQKNQGQVVSRNNAIRRATGQYIAFLDSDDLWHPLKLERQIPLFTKNVGLVYCGIDNIDEHGKVINTVLCDQSVTGDILPQLLIRNRMTGGTVVLTREAVDKVGFFDEEFSAAENWDLWIRVCREYDARLVNEALVQYRIHPGNMSKDRMLMLSAKESIIMKHCSGVPSSEKMAENYRLAKADLAYFKGVYYFSNGEYAKSRTYFFETHSLIPFYEDITMRVFRSYLGKIGNKFIASLKK